MPDTAVAALLTVVFFGVILFWVPLLESMRGSYLRTVLLLRARAARLEKERQAPARSMAVRR